MDNVQQSPDQREYKDTPVSSIKELTEALYQQPSLELYEVYVQLPDGTYREVNAVSTSDDTFVLKLSEVAADPYTHDDE